MNVALSFNNMFKWGGPMNIKWDDLFGYPNHTLTPMKDGMLLKSTKLFGMPYLIMVR
jgi:hypothetical protein